MKRIMNTADFATQHNICVEPNCAPIVGYDEPFCRSANEVAVRTIILQGVVAVAAGVESAAVVAWFKEQLLWPAVTSNEEEFLHSDHRPENVCRELQWHMEAQWALLWSIHRVESLGLPTTECDSRRLVDEIMPALDSDVTEFVSRAKLRSPGELLAEDDRTYDLWCRYHLAKKNKKALPSDLNYWVLYERRYAFEWLNGNQEWDDVLCDS